MNKKTSIHLNEVENESTNMKIPEFKLSSNFISSKDSIKIIETNESANTLSLLLSKNSEKCLNSTETHSFFFRIFLITFISPLFRQSNIINIFGLLIPKGKENSPNSFDIPSSFPFDNFKHVENLTNPSERLLTKET